MDQPNKYRTASPALAASRSVVLLGLILLAGCGSGIHDPNFNPDGTPTTSTYSDNWEMTTVTTSKVSPAAPLSKFTGSIIANQASGAAANSITAVFRVTSGCYLDAPTVPMAGTLASTAFTARSFDVKGQFLSLTSTLNSTSNTMSGNYNIGGGCADGEVGTFTGNRYMALTGTYTGTFTSSGTTHAVSLTLAQDTAPTGDGAFQITGTGTLGSFTCFTNGTIASGGATISGGDVIIALPMSGAASSTATFTGRLSTDGTTLTISNFAVTGTGCAGSYGGVTLKKQ